jgi:hypothetical protein
MPSPHSTSGHASCCGISDPHYMNESLFKNFMIINLHTPHHTIKHYPLSQYTAHNQFPTFSHLLSVCQIQFPKFYQDQMSVVFQLWSTAFAYVYLPAHKAKRRGYDLSYMYLCLEASEKSLNLQALLVCNLEPFFGRGTAAATADICRRFWAIKRAYATPVLLLP